MGLQEALSKSVNMRAMNMLGKAEEKVSYLAPSEIHLIPLL